MIQSRLKDNVITLFRLSKNISDKAIGFDQIENLPEPIRRYFKYALPKRNHFISYVRLKHDGVFRLKPDKKWMKIRGWEYVTTKKVGFVWLGRVPLFSATDLYINGKGKLEVKLFSIFTIMDTKGYKVDVGELLRWLGETPWYPTALLPSDRINYEIVDENSVKVTLTDGGRTVNGIFLINLKGQIIRFSAKRYKNNSLENWTGHYEDYKIVDGMKIPQVVKVTWNLPSGDFCYAKFRIRNIEYNKPELFGN
jgi:hypothetical protein